MQMLMQGRNPDEPKLALAYVVDDMAGHLALTPDGDKTVLLHSGGGDEYFSLGEFTYAFTRLKPDENRQWHVLPDTGHCEAWSSGYAVDLLVKRLSDL